MSRGVILLCLIAAFATPIVALAESSRIFAASLAEMTDPGVVIDPVDFEPPGDGASSASIGGSHPLHGFDLSVMAVLFDAIPIERPRSWFAAPKIDVPPWPYPTRERRLSRLQTFLI